MACSRWIVSSKAPGKGGVNGTRASRHEPLDPRRIGIDVGIASCDRIGSTGNQTRWIPVGPSNVGQNTLHCSKSRIAPACSRGRPQSSTALAARTSCCSPTHAQTPTQTPRPQQQHVNTRSTRHQDVRHQAVGMSAPSFCLSASLCLCLACFTTSTVHDKLTLPLQKHNQRTAIQPGCVSSSADEQAGEGIELR